jgi:hypothetical protein
MLVRFRQDVVALRPHVVHIMAGTNDIAGNTGPTTLEDYQHDILATIDLARANDIAVVVAVGGRKIPSSALCDGGRSYGGGYVNAPSPVGSGVRRQALHTSYRPVEAGLQTRLGAATR